MLPVREYVLQLLVDGGFYVRMRLSLEELSGWYSDYWFDVEVSETLELFPDRTELYLSRNGVDGWVSFNELPSMMITNKLLRCIQAEAKKRVKAYLRLKDKDGKPQLAD